ncbi:MAG: hypothetical protein RR346_06050, partial [Bacteroidales bacterium]
GLRDQVICYLRDKDCCFSDKTLTSEDNIELIQSYMRYVQRLDLTIDDLFVKSFGSHIYQHWCHISDVPLAVIRSQIKNIAKPFYTQKGFQHIHDENDRVNNFKIRDYIEVPELDYSKFEGRPILTPEIFGQNNASSDHDSDRGLNKKLHD